MATFTQHKDVLKTCPYNPLHKVAARRLQMHIVKCSKNPDNPVLMDCPFNASHKIPAKELQNHILMCRDSRQVIREIEESRNRTAPINRPVVNRSDNPISSEDWDLEVDSSKHKNYVIPGLADNEDKNGDEKPFKIKTSIEIQVLKPAERKKYYKELIEFNKNCQQLDANETQMAAPLKEGESSAFPPYLDPREETEVKTEDEDLRRPRTNPFKPRIMGAGIGRGVSPASSRMQLNRSVGMSRESIDSNDNSSHIKRERNDEELRQTKHFSPDFQ